VLELERKHGIMVEVKIWRQILDLAAQERLFSVV